MEDERHQVPAMLVTLLRNFNRLKAVGKAKFLPPRVALNWMNLPAFEDEGTISNGKSSSRGDSNIFPMKKTMMTTATNLMRVLIASLEPMPYVSNQVEYYSAEDV